MAIKAAITSIGDAIDRSKSRSFFSRNSSIGDSSAIESAQAKLKGIV